MKRFLLDVFSSREQDTMQHFTASAMSYHLGTNFQRVVSAGTKYTGGNLPGDCKNSALQSTTLHKYGIVKCFLVVLGEATYEGTGRGGARGSATSVPCPTRTTCHTSVRISSSRTGTSRRVAPSSSALSSGVTSPLSASCFLPATCSSSVWTLRKPPPFQWPTWWPLSPTTRQCPYPTFLFPHR